jgi:hypothetical protein
MYNAIMIHIHLFAASTLLLAPIAVLTAEEIQMCEICSPRAHTLKRSAKYLGSTLSTLALHSILWLHHFLSLVPTNVLNFGPFASMWMSSAGEPCQNRNVETVDLDCQMAFVSLACVTPTCEIYNAYIKLLDADNHVC